MAKYYAIKNGNSKRMLILFSWEDAKEEVSGAKNVIYKSFNSIVEAEKFLKSLDKDISKDTNKEKDKNEISIYVDGSYDSLNERYSYGGVVVKNNVEIDNFSEAIKNEFSPMRNVSGEVYGSINAMKYALLNGYNELNLYFDYQGIESWAKGTWKRNNKLTKSYHEFYEDIKTKIDVKFIKVKGHSGNKFNDRADELAKRALGLI